MCGRAADIHIDESVFALSFIENVEVFKSKRTDGWHSFIRLDYVARGILSPVSSYLSECGVLDIVYFCSGSSTTFYKINEIGSTLSFYIPPESVAGLGKISLIMSHLVFRNGQFSFEGELTQALEAEIIDVELIVDDNIPAKQHLSLMNRACDYINQKLGTNYVAYPGDSQKNETYELTCVRKMNFRCKQQ